MKNSPYYPILEQLGFIFIIILNFINVNKVVADYNVNQYLKATQVNQIDLDYLAKLGPGAIHATLRLEETEEVADTLYRQYNRASVKTWRNMTLDTLIYKSSVPEHIKADK